MSARTDHAPHPLALSNTRPKFPRDAAGFLTELRRRVDAYFAETGQSERDCWRMYLKTAVILVWLATSYTLLVFFAPTVWVAIPLVISFALAISAVGFSIQHDGGHHAYSRHEWVNKFAAMSLDLIGASSYLWKWKHGVFHHTYPNVPGQDTDIDAGVVARLAPQQPRRWHHRWQHLYLWVLYGVTASMWHMYGDFREVIVGRIGPHKIPRPKGWDLAIFIGGKALSIALLWGIPMMVHEWWVVLVFYAAVTAVVGVTLTVVFQLAHCVEEAQFPEPVAGTGKMEDAWAVHQVLTTVDFARNSWTVSWLLGGLNFQVVHHLFPRVSHIHYPALARIIESACRDFGVKYVAHTSLLAGIVSHFRWLRRMGRADAVPG